MGLAINLLNGSKLLLKNQESCIINGGNTTKYFKLEKGTRQGDPISADLFILVFPSIKENKKIKVLTYLTIHFYTQHMLMTQRFF